MSSVNLDDAESLRRAYVEEGLTLSAIAERAGCSYASVRRALLAHDIEIRRSGPAPIGDLRNREWLRARVSEGCSAKDIAALLGCAEGTVRSALQWAGATAVPVRDRPPALDDASFLRRAYVTDGRSVRSIAEELGCTKDAVLGALRSHRVPIRSRGRAPRPVAATIEAREAFSEPLEPSLAELQPVEARATTEPEPEPQPAPAPAPAIPVDPPPAGEVPVEPGDDVVPDQQPESQPEPPEVEPEPPAVATPRPAHAGATLASFPDPSPESVPEPYAAPAPTRPDTGVPVTPTTSHSAATERETQRPSAAGGGDRIPTTIGLPPKIDVEINKIETKTFPITRRGYDRAEVDAFLRSIAKDYRQVIKSAKDAVAAARAAAPAPADPRQAPPPPPPPPTPTAPSFEDVGGRVTAVLTSAAEAAAEIKGAAEKEALAIRQRARQETEDSRRAAAEALAEAERVRAAVQQEAADAEAESHAQADLLVEAARQRVAQLEEEAKHRISTMERTVRANVDAVIAEARRDYEHLRSAQQQCIDRLASVEFLAKHARDGLSDNAGQSLDELL